MLPNPGPQNPREPPRGISTHIHPILRIGASCLCCCHCWLSRAQPTGLKAWPLGSSPSSTRLAPAGAPGLRELHQQHFSCQEAGIICALRCLEPRRGAHGRSLCVRTGQGCGRGNKGGGRQQCLFCFVLASAIRTVKQPWGHHQ